MRLKDKVILITGSTTGIGEGMARVFSREGARVMVHGPKQGHGEALAAEIGGGFAFGLLEEAAVPAKLIAETVSRFGRIDGLVNNAAAITRSNLETTDSAVFDYTLAVNLKAPLLLIQAALPWFRKQSSGSVLNIGSINAYCGERNQLAYSISKGGLMTMTRNLADAHAREGIRVNQLNVGWTLTPNEYALKRSEGLPEDWPHQVSKTFAPAGRLLSPEEVAWAAVYFVSDEALLVNGAILDLNQYPIIGRNPHERRFEPPVMKPKLAAFPKCYMDELCIHHTMTVAAWIELAATLGVDGLEFYSGFVEDDAAFLSQTRKLLAQHKLAMPMLCCSPDFTEPDPVRLQAEIEREKRMIEITACFGGRFCRVLSGQRRPELKREDGIDQVVRVITSLLPFAESHGVVLTIENHYKDNYWQYPEFAQKMDVFVEIVDQIDSPWFGVNYDPSNTILAGEDPLLLLERVKHRVVTMHASDRYLKTGTIEDLRKEETSVGYASRLSHGVIGKGLNDYDKIFSTLASVGFDSWISIEDGVNGMDELRESVSFLRAKIDQHFPGTPGVPTQGGNAQ